ncbi:MAG: hypothetical protein GY772_16955 [bacterium]|nr:hypothetical protein [bacterium]
MTGLAGFVNSSYGIVQRPSAVLEFNAERPLGEHSLVLKLAQTVTGGQEITIAYGPKHPVGQTRQKSKGLRAKPRKRSEVF